MHEKALYLSHGNKSRCTGAQLVKLFACTRLATRPVIPTSSLKAKVSVETSTAVSSTADPARIIHTLVECHSYAARSSVVCYIFDTPDERPLYRTPVLLFVAPNCRTELMSVVQEELADICRSSQTVLYTHEPEDDSSQLSLMITPGNIINIPNFVLATSVCRDGVGVFQFRCQTRGNIPLKPFHMWNRNAPRLHSHGYLPP